jgi:hypothetical protein
MALESRLQELEHVPEHSSLNVEPKHDKDDDDRSTTASAPSQLLEMSPELKPEEELQLNDSGFEELFDQNTFSQAENYAIASNTYAMGYFLGQMSASMPAPLWSSQAPVWSSPAPLARRKKKDRSMITMAAKHGKKFNSFENRGQNSACWWNPCQQPPKAQSDHHTARKTSPQEQAAACDSCRHCGSAVQKHFRFCQHCGEAVSV